MCLVTSQLEPYIVPVDIPVVKVLLREDCYLTYFRRTVVKLNRILQPYEDYKRFVDRDQLKQRLRRGLIHAYLSAKYTIYGVVCACLKRISQKELNSLCQTIIKRSLRQSYISQANGRQKTLGLSIENYIKL